MKAVVQIKGKADPCVIYWTGRVRLHVGVTTWCGEKFDASDGVLQIPDGAKVCSDCDEQIKIGAPKL